jgi:hypothetical protein
MEIEYDPVLFDEKQQEDTDTQEPGIHADKKKALMVRYEQS